MNETSAQPVSSTQVSHSQDESKAHSSVTLDYFAGVGESLTETDDTLASKEKQAENLCFDLMEDDTTSVADLFLEVSSLFESPKVVTVNKVSSTSMLFVPIRLGEIEVKAVVDTAAEVSIISDKIYSVLHPQPPPMENIILQTADRNQRREAMIVGLIPITLGSVRFDEKLETICS